MKTFTLSNLAKWLASLVVAGGMAYLVVALPTEGYLYLRQVHDHKHQRFDQVYPGPAPAALEAADETIPISVNDDDDSNSNALCFTTQQERFVCVTKDTALCGTDWECEVLGRDQELAADHDTMKRPL